jgi:hypothetical protein
MGSQATRPWLVWTVTALAALSLILVIVNAYLTSSNRGAQAVIYQRQQQINQSTFWTRLERGLTQALANAAVNHRDEDVKALLQKYNVTISNWPAAPAGAPAAPSRPAGSAGGGK